MSKIVAVIGASSDRRKFGNRALRAYVQQGFTVLAINPNETEVEGIKAYASVLDVPGPIDMATFYVPPDIGERVIDEVAKKGIPEVWLNPGAESDARRPGGARNVPQYPANSGLQHHVDWRRSLRAVRLENPGVATYTRISS